MAQSSSGPNSVVITREQFESALPEVADEVDVPGTTERVYKLPLPSDDLSIYVFSTVEGERTRPYGADAIRTVVWSDHAEGPVGGETKTLRVKTWRKNLRAKVRSLYENWRDFDHGECPACGDGVLVRRDSSYSGYFLACSDWNGGRGCDYTFTPEH